MNCKRCGYPIKIGDKICKNCGLQVNSLNNKMLEEKKKNAIIYNVDNNYGRNIAQNLKSRPQSTKSTTNKNKKLSLLIILPIIFIIILIICIVIWKIINFKIRLKRI